MNARQYIFSLTLLLFSGISIPFISPASAQHTFDIDSLPQVSKITFPFKQSKTITVFDLYCVQDHAGINFLLEYENAEGEALFTDIDFEEFSTEFKTFSKRLRKRKRKLEKSTSPSASKLRRLNKKIRSTRKVRKRFKRCSQGHLTSPPSYFNPDNNQSLFATAEENSEFEHACSLLSGQQQKAHQRIINGTLCEQDEVAVVRLRLTFNDGSRKYCSASFITPSVLLSAAHCLVQEEGTAVTFEAELTQGYVPLARYEIPSEYEQGAGKETYDIALLFFKEPQSYPLLPLTTTAKPIVGETAVLAGFGKEQYDRAYLFLKAGEAAIFKATDTGINTFFTGSGSSTCRGDSGGPLLIKRAGEWTIAGVSSRSTHTNCGIGNTSAFAYLGNDVLQAFLAEHLPK